MCQKYFSIQWWSFFQTENSSVSDPNCSLDRARAAQNAFLQFLGLILIKSHQHKHWLEHSISLFCFEHTAIRALWCAAEFSSDLSGPWWPECAPVRLGLRSPSSQMPSTSTLPINTLVPKDPYLTCVHFKSKHGRSFIKCVPKYPKRGEQNNW